MCSRHTFLCFHATEYPLFPSKYVSSLNHPFYSPKSLQDSYKGHSNHRMTKGPLPKPQNLKLAIFPDNGGADVGKVVLQCR